MSCKYFEHAWAVEGTYTSILSMLILVLCAQQGHRITSVLSVANNDILCLIFCLVRILRSSKWRVCRWSYILLNTCKAKTIHRRLMFPVFKMLLLVPSITPFLYRTKFFRALYLQHIINLLKKHYSANYLWLF